jgi:amino acid transporter
VTRANTEQSLVRALGVWGLAASIVNLTVGGGIFRLPASAATALGSAAPLAYVVCAVAMGLIVLCFAEAGSRVSLTGGLYAYVEVAFGPFVGFLCGVMLWAGISVATAAVASFFADAVGALFPALASSTARKLTITVVLAAFAWLNIAGIRGASRFVSVMTVAKLLPLALFILVGAFAVKGDNLAWTTSPAAGDVARASTVLIFAFLGVESALVPSGEVRDPARTVPRAIFIAMIGVTVLYLATQIVAQGVLGSSLAGQKTPLAEAAAVVMGEPGRTLILVGSTISMFGYLSGMILSAPRMLFAFGRDGFMPASFAKVHEKFRTPYIAIVVQTAIVIGVAVSGSFEVLAIIANGTILLVYAACCVAVLELRRRGVQESGTPFRAPLAGVIPVLALLVIGWLLMSLTAGEWKSLLVVIVAAIVVYVLSLPSRRAGRTAGVEPAA